MNWEQNKFKFLVNHIDLQSINHNSIYDHFNKRKKKVLPTRERKKKFNSKIFTNFNNKSNKPQSS